MNLSLLGYIDNDSILTSKISGQKVFSDFLNDYALAEVFLLKVI